MATYVFYADRPEKRRADGRNTVVAQGANLAAARAAAELLVGPGTLSDFAAVDVTAPVPAFVVEGWPPVGAPDQITWPTLTRGGDRLRV
jgi:hypothetical protein